jgi:hypothetical protein
MIPSPVSKTNNDWFRSIQTTKARINDPSYLQKYDRRSNISEQVPAKVRRPCLLKFNETLGRPHKELTMS